MALLGAASVEWPFSLRAQQPVKKNHRLGVLTLTERREQATSAKRWLAFFDELRNLGYQEGHNLIVEWHSMGGNVHRAHESASAILDLRPDLVFTPDLRVITSLKAITTTLSIVVIAPDPVGMGFGANLARPGGNITGFDIAPGVEIIAKRVELLKEAVPTASRLGWLAPRLGAGGVAPRRVVYELWVSSPTQRPQESGGVGLLIHSAGHRESPIRFGYHTQAGPKDPR